MNSLNVTIQSPGGNNKSEANVQSLTVENNGQTFRFEPDDSGNLCLYKGTSHSEIWNQSQSKTTA